MHIKHGRFINDVDGIIEEANNFNCKEVYLKYIEDEGVDSIRAREQKLMKRFYEGVKDI